MIGQQKLTKQIDRIVGSGFPRFSIIHGTGICGKKMMAKYVAKKLEVPIVFCGIKVDEIRDIILLAYKQSEPILYLIPDADKMSPAAKNALLKITEEPPRQAYFIMTLQDPASTLATLRSRGTLFAMDPYSRDDLLAYIKHKEYDLTEDEEMIMLAICSNPGEVDTLVRYDVKAFYEYVENVAQNIGIVNGANAFKIGTKFSYKDNDDGWEPTLFLRAIMLFYLRKMQVSDFHNCYDSIKMTSRYLSELSINGINKSSTIDMWILGLRDIWLSD